MKLRNILEGRVLQQSNRLKLQFFHQTAGERAVVASTKHMGTQEYSIKLQDDQFFQLNVTALFPAGAAPLQDFLGDGLPQWANIDFATGVISGTVAHDASVFGRTEVLVTALDKCHNELSLTVVLYPQNLASIADTTIHDRIVEEQSSLDMELESLFYDPFVETTPKIICVSGLPRGLYFDPTTDSISGAVLDRAVNRAPYVVTAWARVAQNRLISQHFLLKVTTVHQEEAEVSGASEIVWQPDDRRAKVRAAKLAKLRSSFVSKKADEAIDDQNSDSVWKGGDIEGSWGIEMPNDGKSDAAGSLIPEYSNIDWNETVTDLKQKHKREVLSRDDRLDRISLDAMRRQNKLYLEFQNSLDAERDGEVQRASIQGKGGKSLPDWMNMVREGFVTATPPRNVKSIELELNVEFGNGHRLIKPVRVDF